MIHRHFGKAAARSITVEHRKTQEDQDEHHRPAQERYHGCVDAAEPERGQNQRENHHRANRDADSGDGADREEERYDIEPDETALLLFVIDDVERIKDGFHPGIGAPQAMASPTTNPKVSLPSLLAAMREISLVKRSSVTVGTISVATDRCLPMVAASAKNA